MFWKKKEENEKYIRIKPLFKEMSEEVIKLAEHMASGEWETISMEKDVGVFACGEITIRMHICSSTIYFSVGKGHTSYSIKDTAKLTNYEERYLKPFMKPFVKKIKEEDGVEEEEENILSELFKPKAKPKKKKE